MSIIHYFRFFSLKRNGYLGILALNFTFNQLKRKPTAPPATLLQKMHASFILGFCIIESPTKPNQEWMEQSMSDFKWRHFQGEIILWVVRWYCKYGISYRELEERGIKSRSVAKNLELNKKILKNNFECFLSFFNASKVQFEK